MTRVMLIVNPSSGNEAGEEYAAYVREKLQQKYDEVETVWTEKRWDATRFAARASEERYEAVFALGGDGTVSECINGIAEKEYRPVFGFIPLGTVNDLGRVLGISMNPEKAIEDIPKLTTRLIDVGKVNEHYFADVLAIGSIPEAVHDVSVEQKTRLGTMAYIIEGARALKDNETLHFQLSLDDETAKFDSFLVLVALSNSIGGIQTMIPQAAVDDGYLHALALKGGKVIDKLNIVPKIFSGKVTEDETVYYQPFKQGTIEIKEDKKVTVNVDGDEGDALPLSLKVLPRHIRCFVPEDGDE